VAGERAGEVGSEIWTVPNILSMLRLALVPVFLVFIVRGDYVVSLAVLIVASLTDLLDGYLARRLGQVTRLGQLLDPAADRLYIVATLVALALRDIVPLWLVAVLVGREVVLAGVLVVLRRHGYPALQVHYLGKAATFLLLYAFPILLLAQGSGPVAAVAEPIAWAFTIWGTAFYVLAGLLYLVQAAGLVRAARTGAGP
jgi:cardiolipin synthase